MIGHALTRRALVAGGASALTTPDASERALADFFERAFEEEVAADPNLRSVRAVAGDQSRWTLPDEGWTQDLRARSLRNIDTAARMQNRPLSQAARLSLKLFRYEAEQTVARCDFSLQTFPFKAWECPPLGQAFLLTAYHQINDVGGAEDYIARLWSLPTAARCQMAEAERRADRGVRLPAADFPGMIEMVRAWPRGAPFDAGPDHALIADFKAKLSRLSIADDQRSRLLTEAGNAIVALAPLCAEMAERLKRLGSISDHDFGAWALPDGDAFYRFCLKDNTTLALEPAELHAFGQSEVDRVSRELLAVSRRAGLGGDLGAVLQQLRSGPNLFAPNTAEGRATLVREATRTFEEMKGRLCDFFTVRPKADVVLRLVDSSSGGGRAFYVESSPDGRRPGVFFLNVNDTRTQPRAQLQAVVYHESLPGHHMQQAIAAEQLNLPRFRRHLSHNAYAEGWALYAEYFPSLAGLYRDPMSDVGRLCLELLRAARVVVDTGVNEKRWTRAKAQAYLDRITPDPPDDNKAEVQRALDWPGQATSYQVGAHRIRQMRRSWESGAGRADVRKFHDAVLSGGSMPLDILEATVSAARAAG